MVYKLYCNILAVISQVCYHLLCVCVRQSATFEGLFIVLKPCDGILTSVALWMMGRSEDLCVLTIPEFEWFQ